METKLTLQFNQLAEAEMGLDVGQTDGRASNAGTWYVYGGDDGLETVLVVGWDFQAGYWTPTLEGPAVLAADAAKLRAGLPIGVGFDPKARDRKIQFHMVKYDETGRMRLVFSTIRTLLDPYRRAHPEPEFHGKVTP
jgi:hypothetical protein